MPLCGCQSPVSEPQVPPEPEPPNPFNQLTDQELEEYKQEVQRKQDGGTDGKTSLHQQVKQDGHAPFYRIV